MCVCVAGFVCMCVSRVCVLRVAGGGGGGVATGSAYGNITSMFKLSLTVQVGRYRLLMAQHGVSDNLHEGSEN